MEASISHNLITAVKCLRLATSDRVRNVFSLLVSEAHVNFIILGLASDEGSMEDGQGKNLVVSRKQREQLVLTQVFIRNSLMRTTFQRHTPSVLRTSHSVQLLRTMIRLSSYT